MRLHTIHMVVDTFCQYTFELGFMFYVNAVGDTWFTVFTCVRYTLKGPEHSILDGNVLAKCMTTEVNLFLCYGQDNDFPPI